MTSRSAIQAGLVVVSTVTVAASFWYERFEVWALAIAIVAYVGLLAATHLWERQRAVAIAGAINLLLVFAYLWSLGEQVHVVIHADAAGFTAQVGRDVLSVRRTSSGSGIGLQAGTMWDYRVQPTGEALAQPSSAPLNRFGDFMRLATPQPAWSDLRISDSSGTVAIRSPSQLRTYTGSWAVNRRGELEGDVGSSALIEERPRGAFTISGDLSRADGTQGILVGISPYLTGDYFAIRMDRPDMSWFQWDRTVSGATLATMPLDLSLVPTVQRLTRIVLGNVIAALVILAAALPVYAIMTALGARGEIPLPATVASGRLADAIGAAAALAGVCATALIASALLQRIPHVQDSVAYLFQAKTLALGELAVPAPRLPSFFTEEFIPMYHGLWFGKYPPGWPLLLALGVLLHIPWLIDPLLTGGNLALLYLIGREVYGRGTAVLATVIALASPLLLFLGGSFMAHTATLFYLNGFAYAAIRWVRRVEAGEASGHDRWLVLAAGFLLGMGFITRQLDAVAFAAPFALLLVSRPVLQRIRSVGLLVVGGAAPVAGLLVYDWRLTGSPLTSPYTLWWSFDRVGFYSNIGNGFGLTQGLWNTTLNLQYLQAHLFGWPFYFTLALAAIPFLVGRATRWDALFGASALCIIAAYIFYWNPGVMYGPRYYYVAVPWLALLSARGLQELYRWQQWVPLRLGRNPAAAVAAPVLLLALALAYDLGVYLPVQVPMYRGYNFTSAAALDAVARARVHHALIFVVSNPGVWYTYGDVFSANSPRLDGDVVYARDEGRSNIRLMRLYPHRSYYRLDGTRITRLRR